MKKIIAILLLLPLITAGADTNTNTTSDFMANYTIIPEHDVTYSLVNAIKEMTITQFAPNGTQISPSKISQSERKDKNRRSTYNFKSEKIMYRLEMTWDYDAALMNFANYIGLSLKGMKVQGTWKYKPISDQAACTGKMDRTFSDIDSLLDILLKFSINNTAAAKNEIKSDELFQSIAPDQNCKDENANVSKAVVSKNLEDKSYLKILTMALEVIPSLYDGNANAELIPKAGDSYAYFINDNDTTSGYNDEVMIRGLHQLKKITVQYPDYGQVTNASEFKIPMWRANLSWFRCNEKERPMHMDVETEYLILKGNISGAIGNLGIEFNLPDTITINGYSKKVEAEDKTKLKELHVLIRDVINQTSPQKESMLQYNINSPLIHTITQITRSFNNKIFTNSTKSWSSSSNPRRNSFSNLEITPTPPFSTSNIAVCKFNNTLRINLFNYEKIIGRGDNCNEYGRISQSKNVTQNCTFQIFIREPSISAIHKSTEGPSTELKPSGKNLLMFNFTAKHPNKDRRGELGKALNEAFTETIRNRIAGVATPPEMPDICKQPFKNATEIYTWFLPDQREREYYFAVDDEYIDPTNFSSELKLIDIMIKNMTKFESVEVRYLSDDVTNFNLSIRNVSGNMIQAGNGKEPAELNFTMDLFQLIMNYSTIENLTDVKVQTNGFKVKSFIRPNESLIRGVFEKTTADFMKRVFGSNQTNEKPSPPAASRTQPKNQLFDANRIDYLNATYNIANHAAQSIANILWDFHNNTENQTSESNATKLNNFENGLQGYNLTNTSMEYTILGIQNETCDFEKIFRANYEDIHVVLKGSITTTNISKKCFPFSLLISSLSISREKDDTNFQTEMSFDDKRIFVNTSNTDIDSSDRTIMKHIIRDYVEPKIKEKIDQSWRFSGLFNTCRDSVKEIVKTKAEPENYFYLISSPNHTQTFHLPLRINYIAIWGFSNFHSIETTKVRNGTTFQFVVKNLVARVNWSFHYADNTWSNSTHIMDLHAGSISLAGKINKITSELTWEKTRLIFKILMLPPPKKKTITEEKIMHKVNETMLSHIKTSIENSFNSIPKK
ncbi:uncharacterized protein LOC135837150 [Planococcus citri]|uniref:uncharacterized protein LOC135837150 n=1 Tax=Planococcus citri TaxID=170843 RepID=UPI0031F87745